MTSQYMFNFYLRILALGIYFIRIIYWFITGQKTEKEKPKKKTHNVRSQISKVFTYSIDILIIFQLLGLSVLPVQENVRITQLIGIVLVFIGVSICVIARKEIADNWVHGAEYQIKRKQELITSGIYAYIRHPIYFGAILSYIGAEMVSKSYLYISFFAFFFVFYLQSKREEKILLAHFGNPYKEYMKKTKMLIPFVF